MDPLSAVSDVSAHFQMSIDVYRRVIKIVSIQRQHENITKIKFQTRLLDLCQKLIDLQTLSLQYARASPAMPPLDNIFRHCSKVLHELQETYSDNLFRFWTPLSEAAFEDSITGDLSKLEDLLQSLSAFNSRLRDRSSMYEISDDQSDPQALMKSSQQLTGEPHQELALLTRFDPRGRHRQIRNVRIDEACSWLPKSQAFQTWQTATDTGQNFHSKSVLWCYGKAGSGKSVLSSYVVDLLSGTLEDPNRIAVLFHYCDYGHHESLQDIIKSLMTQLVLLKPLPHLRKILERWDSPNVSADLMFLVEKLKSAFLEIGSVCVVLDALDEHPAFESSEMITLLARIMGTPCKVMLTTRSLDVGIAHYIRHRSLQVNVAPEKDTVDTLIHDRVAKSWALQYVGSEQRNKLAFAIVRNSREVNEQERHDAEGNDLYNLLAAELLLEWSFEQLSTDGNIDIAVRAMPNSLGGMLSKPLDLVGHQSKSGNRLRDFVLMWMTYAKRPMSVSEICQACAMSFLDDDDNQAGMRDKAIPTPELIKTVCAGLIRYDDHGSEVRFQHHSIFEYYKEQCKVNLPQAPQIIALACIRYLMQPDFGLQSFIDGAKAKLFRHHPFLSYVCDYWADHCQQSIIDDDKIRLSSGITSVYDHERAKLLGMFAVGMQDLLQNGRATVCTLLRMSLERKQKDDDLHLYSTDSIGYTTFTPLHLAARYGFIGEVRRLLDSSLNVPLLFPADERCSTPMHEAGKGGHSQVIQLLYDKTGLARALTATDAIGRTPLHWAAAFGHTNVVDLLLDNVEAYTTAQPLDSLEYSPLMLAAASGRVEVVKRLIERSSSLIIKNSHGRNALHYAASGNQPDICRILIHRGFGCDEADLGGKTALHLAASKGLTTTCGSLLQIGAELSPTDEKGDTPLHKAAKGGHSDLAEYLLDNGAPPNAMNNATRTPLAKAVESEDLATVKILIARGANRRMYTTWSKFDAMARTVDPVFKEQVWPLLIEGLWASTADTILEDLASGRLVYGPFSRT